MARSAAIAVTAVVIARRAAVAAIVIARRAATWQPMTSKRMDCRAALAMTVERFVMANAATAVTAIVMARRAAIAVTAVVIARSAAIAVTAIVIARRAATWQPMTSKRMDCRAALAMTVERFVMANAATGARHLHGEARSHSRITAVVIAGSAAIAVTAVVIARRAATWQPMTSKRMDCRAALAMTVERFVMANAATAVTAVVMARRAAIAVTAVVMARRAAIAVTAVVIARSAATRQSTSGGL